MRRDAWPPKVGAQDLLESDAWQVRPGDDRWLRQYLDELERVGRVYVEVPIGAGGGRTRRIDAVRFPRLEGGVRYFQRPASRPMYANTRVRSSRSSGS